MNYVLEYSLLKLFINHRCHKTPQRTPVICTPPGLALHIVSLGSMSYTALLTGKFPRRSPEAFSFKRMGLKCTCSAFLSECWLPYLATWRACGSCVGLWKETDKLFSSVWHWDFTLSWKLVCKRTVKGKRIRACGLTVPFSRPLVRETSKEPPLAILAKPEKSLIVSRSDI